MNDKVKVYDAFSKLVVVDDQKFLCDIIIIIKIKDKRKFALCRGENLDTGEKTGWIKIDDTLNPAHSFGDYLLKNK